MAVTTVKSVIDKVKIILQETTDDGIRWSNQELLGWLNDAYKQFVKLKPDCSSVNAEHSCELGTKQAIPSNGVRFLDCVRNLDGSMNAITSIPRSVIDRARRGWHGDTPSATVDHVIFDEIDPKHFYLSPPPLAGTRIEIIYAAVPTDHVGSEYDDGVTVVKLDDRYVPDLIDYILYRAYSKDADYAGNANRAINHQQSYMNSLGAQNQVDNATSPNAG